MATLIYVTGNGYHCGCCRRTDTNYMDFEEDEYGITSLIGECVELSSYAEGDFYIEAIKGYSGDETELENKITAAIAVAEKRAKHKKEIDSVKRSITEIESWFNSLEATKASKTKLLESYRAKLSELEN